MSADPHPLDPMLALRETPAARRRRTAAIFERLRAALPEPKTELNYRNPYTLLVAVVLSAQATDAGVNKATGPLFAIVTTPAQMLALGETQLKRFIQTIGLFNTKAKNVIALSQLLIERHGGEVPEDRDALQALPGVGRKTANVVLQVAFGHGTIAVDTHVFRVANRLQIGPGRTPDAVEAALMAVVGPEHLHHAHHLLILHGRYTCTARKPACERCPVLTLCPWPAAPTTIAPARLKAGARPPQPAPQYPARMPAGAGATLPTPSRSKRTPVKTK